MGVTNVRKLGFGCMRLPLNSDDVTDIDQEEFNKMVDLFMERGYTYFDTGYHYHSGSSESALRKALIERHPRQSYTIADKLPVYSITSEEELEPIFNEQLERLAVEYFDYYLLHNLCKYSEKGFVDVDSFSFVNKKKDEGYIRHIGISFHDHPEMLDEILTQHPEIEFVQLQINYYDWDDDNVEARKCYEIAKKHQKDVIVMEPIKGGTLVNLPEDAEKLLKEYNPTSSAASWALRFVASLDKVKIVLSGMTTLDQVKENTKILKDFREVNDEELEIITKVTDILKNQITIKCTKCNYCIDYCPKNINIAKLFDLYNTEVFLKPTGFSPQGQYYRTYAKNEGVGIASDCIECGACMQKCPQHLKIPEHLKDVAEIFEIPMYGFNTK